MSISKQPIALGDSWDVHAHAVPAEVVREAALGKFGMAWDGKAVHVRGDKLHIENLEEGRWLQNGRHELADNIILSVPPALIRNDLIDDETQEWTRLINDGLERICVTGDRLWGLAYLPMHDQNAAIREIERCHGAPWLGFYIGTTVNGISLDDARFDSIYEVLDERKAFVLVHPLRSPDERLSKYYLENLLGNPYETGLAMASFILSGKPLQYPNVKFCFSHAGGVTPQLLGRWQRGHDTKRPGLNPSNAGPYEVAKQLYVDCVAHNSSALELSIKVFGLDHVLPGTDHPFPMGQSLSSSLNSLSESVRETILRKNTPSILAIPDLRSDWA